MYNIGRNVRAVIFCRKLRKTRLLDLTQIQALPGDDDWLPCGRWFDDAVIGRDGSGNVERKFIVHSLIPFTSQHDGILPVSFLTLYRTHGGHDVKYEHFKVTE